MGTHVRRCPRFLFSLMLRRLIGDGGGGDGGQIRFLDSSTLHRFSMAASGAANAYFLTLGEQFRTPSLESVTIHTVRPFLSVLMRRWRRRGSGFRWFPNLTGGCQLRFYMGSLAGCVVFLNRAFFMLLNFCYLIFFYLVISFYGTLVSFLKVKVHP